MYFLKLKILIAKNFNEWTKIMRWEMLMNIDIFQDDISEFQYCDSTKTNTFFKNH